MDVQLRERLREWAIRNQVKNRHTDQLLKLLREHGHTLPKTARTLLKSNKNFNVQRISGMEYVYFGLADRLCAIAAKTKCKELNISLNVDGLPLFKSSLTSPWPVLCYVAETGQTFTIAMLIHRGHQAKDSAFLAETCEELSKILVEGILVEGKTVPVNLTCIMADAPARSLIKATKTYAAYHGCDKCEEKGTYTKGYVRHKI